MLKIFLSILLFSLTSPIFAQSLTANKVAMTCVSGTISTSAVACDSDITDNSGVSVSVGVPMTASSGITANITGNVTGNLTGNVTGNLTGTVTTAAQPSITSLGTLTGLTVSGALSAYSNLYVTSTGVGIGTSSPSQPLEVAGNGYIHGTLDLGGTVAVVQGVSGVDLSLNSSGGDVYTNAWADYSATSSIVGWSSFTTKSILYKRVGKLVFVQFNIYGTSNANTASFTVPYAVSSSYPSDVSEFCIMATDNGNVVYIGVFGFFSQNSLSIGFANNGSGLAWTSSGTKGIKGQFFYQSA